MPRPFEDDVGLPFWDTFEVVFFFVTGISVGLVIGVLFPSLWRTFRRSFRNTRRYMPTDKKWLRFKPKEFKKIEELTSDEINQFDKEESYEGESELKHYFVQARFAFQQGDLKFAAACYLQILQHKMVSKGLTNQAMFELSQVYLHAGILDRAKDTLNELLHRKPKEAEVLLGALEIYYRDQDENFLLECLKVYDGKLESSIQRKICHILCKIAEDHFVKNENRHEDASRVTSKLTHNTPLKFAHQAMRWDTFSARPRYLTWEITSQELWKTLSKKHSVSEVVKAWKTDISSLITLSESHPVSPWAVVRGFANCILSWSRAMKQSENFDNWPANTLPVSPEITKIGSCSLLYLLKQRHTAEIESWKPLLPSLGIDSSSFLMKLQDAQKNPIIFDGFISSTQTHTCSVCNHSSVTFFWECPSCCSYETLSPNLKGLNKLVFP